MNSIEQINQIIQEQIDELSEGLSTDEVASPSIHFEDVLKIFKNEKLKKISASKALAQIHKKLMSKSVLIFMFKAAKDENILRKKIIKLSHAFMMLGAFKYQGKGELIWKSEEMRKAVNLKISKDPKTIALNQIKKEFKASSYPFKKRGYTAKFTKEMWEKYPVIESIKTIEKLVTKLKREMPSN